jgi:hypothetical protein
VTQQPTGRVAPAKTVKAIRKEIARILDGGAL